MEDLFSITLRTLLADTIEVQELHEPVEIQKAKFYRITKYMLTHLSPTATQGPIHIVHYILMSLAITSFIHSFPLTHPKPFTKYILLTNLARVSILHIYAVVFRQGDCFPGKDTKDMFEQNDTTTNEMMSFDTLSNISITL